MKRILLLYAALAAAALGYTGYWFVLADRAGRAVDGEIATLAARGVAVSHEGRRIAGYPYRLSVAFAGPSAAWSGGGADWRWRADSVTAHAEPWNLRHYVAVFDGDHRLRRAARGGLPGLDLSIAAGEARASLVMDGAWQPLRAVADLADLRIAPREGGGAVFVSALRLAARRAEPEGGEAVEIAADISGLTLPGTPYEELGRRIALLSVAGTLAGPPPRAWSAAALSRWRESGGAFRVRTLAIEWGPFTLRGEGRLGLDAALRPQGEIDARIVGFPAFVDALSAHGVLNSAAAGMLLLAVGLLAETPPGGGRPEVPVPIVLRGGFLSIGPVPVMALPPVAGQG